MDNNLIAVKCSCGAITVSAEKEQWSMPLKLFKKHFPDLKLEEYTYGSCDYCVNHYGIDLCGCGSGKKVGKCNNGFKECRNNIPAQRINV